MCVRLWANSVLSETKVPLRHGLQLRTRDIVCIHALELAYRLVGPHSVQFPAQDASVSIATHKH